MSASNSPTEAVEGGCLCGAVRYRAGGEASDVTHCHCTICRRASAAPFVPWATFRAADFSFTKGTPGTFASSGHAQRSFCPQCGTPLTFQLLDKRDEIDITLCSMDAPEKLTPTSHIWSTLR